MNGTIIQGFLSNTRGLKVFRGGAHLHQVKAKRGGGAVHFNLSECLYAEKTCKHMLMRWRQGPRSLKLRVFIFIIWRTVCFSFLTSSHNKHQGLQ